MLEANIRAYTLLWGQSKECKTEGEGEWGRGGGIEFERELWLTWSQLCPTGCHCRSHEKVLPPRAVLSESRRYQNLPTSDCLALVKFYPLGHRLPYMLSSTYMDIEKVLWHLTLEYQQKPGKGGKDIWHGLQVGAFRYHSWEPLVQSLQEAPPSSIGSCSPAPGSRDQHKPLKSLMTSQVHTPGLAHELVCHFPSPMEIFTSYYYY